MTCTRFQVTRGDNGGSWNDRAVLTWHGTANIHLNGYLLPTGLLLGDGVL
jgi:hypothetical protein